MLSAFGASRPPPEVHRWILLKTSILRHSTVIFPPPEKILRAPMGYQTPSQCGKQKNTVGNWLNVDKKKVAAELQNV